MSMRSKCVSPWGVMDLVGNVWQWTKGAPDEHTRAAVVRGGSYYRPKGSMWYFPQNTRLDRTRNTCSSLPRKTDRRCSVSAA